MHQILKLTTVMKLVNSAKITVFIIFSFLFRDSLYYIPLLVAKDHVLLSCLHIFSRAINRGKSENNENVNSEAIWRCLKSEYVNEELMVPI